MPAKPRVLILIAACNAEHTLAAVVRRLPVQLLDTYQVDVLISDDASTDRTFEQGHDTRRAGDSPFPIHVLVNPVNQGCGGNQKLGYHYALKYGYDFVALIPGDGQCTPECLPALLEPLRTNEADAVFGSRMLTRSAARKRGMPLSRFARNKILTWIENRLLNEDFSEYHSGYRIYSTRALSAIPFDRNSNGVHFDTEIIIQLLTARLTIRELPLPAYDSDEIGEVNGLTYAFNVLMAVVTTRLQHMGLFYDRKFDCAPGPLSQYLPKLNYRSPHSLALEFVRPGARVLDLGCAGGYLAAALHQHKQCAVTGVDACPAQAAGMEAFYLHDLNTGMPPLDLSRFDFVLMLDVVEHLTQPEQFLEQLRRAMALHPDTELILSTGNVGFFIPRLMLLLGQFNYGKRGILDLTHTRLFTFRSLLRAVEQAGFSVITTQGVPGPFPLALGDNGLSRFLLGLNQALIRLSRGLFSYQIMIRAKAAPVLETLLRYTEEHSATQERLLERRLALKRVDDH